MKSKYKQSIDSATGYDSYQIDNLTIEIHHVIFLGYSLYNRISYTNYLITNTILLSK